jgi:hypothetical protein
MLPTVFPSLRAHLPNPAELEIHPDLAGYGVSPVAAGSKSHPGTMQGRPRKIGKAPYMLQSFALAGRTFTPWRKR